MKNRGQITIFVVIALLLVAAIIIFFFIFRGSEISLRQDFDNPQGFIDNCIREELRDTVDIMLPQGGFVSPEDYIIHDNSRVAYLCKNINYSEPCVTQHPRYITRIEEEIEVNIEEKIEQCFVLFENELEKRNYEYGGENVEIDVALKPGAIETTIYRDFSFNKQGVTRTFHEFAVAINSPLYDLAHVANEIASQEAKFCYFEYVGFNLLYPDIDIRKDSLSDSTEIYTLTHKKTGDEMNIAIRGCVIPAGF
jgi:hypothetical protein